MTADELTTVLTIELSDACRLLSCFERKLRDLGEVSQADAINRHIAGKEAFAKKGEHYLLCKKIAR